MSPNQRKSVFINFLSPTIPKSKDNLLYIFLNQIKDILGQRSATIKIIYFLGIHWICNE